MNIEETFRYHAPSGSQPERYQSIREKAKELATLIDRSCPESREKSAALTNLQQAVMWANASIAINEVKSHAD
jgi:hypothetical protein